jgi:ATP/maltotriose-dependent transcriptional regulator MalT
MHLAQGQPQVAASSITRALEEARHRSARARLLPAYVEIMLVRGEIERARAAADELSSLAAELEAPFIAACAAQALGAVELAAGDPRVALLPLREACAQWQEMDAPYEAARTRELIGVACRALGDAERAQLELDAAAWTYQQLGATPDLARVKTTGRPRQVGGLSEREVQVLRLLAAGRTNRAIADELVLSEKTVARHVSNIFNKLGLSSRAAATAYAYEHAVV